MNRFRMSMKASSWAVLLAFVLTLNSAFLLETKSELNKKGNKLYEKKKYSDAIEVYRKAQIKDPQSAPIRYNLGNSLYELNDFTEAEKEYMKWLWDNHLSELLPMPDRVALFGPLLQLGRNTSWSRRSIEPKFAREYTPPHLIVKKGTTETAKRVMSLKPLRFTGISPVQMEYFVNQVTGGLYRRTVGGAETAVKVIMGKNVRTRPAGPWDLPIVGGLFARPSLLNTKWTERFYAHWKDMNQRRRSDHPHLHENVLKRAQALCRERQFAGPVVLMQSRRVARVQ